MQAANAMAATAAMMHGGYQAVNGAPRLHQVQHTQHSQRTEHIQHNDQQAQTSEPYLATFFCRALYDYNSNDSSSLSFYRGEIIEVLTQLESGWWDGLLHDERGWFPSNYVAPISDAEAEAELGPIDFSMRQTTEAEVHDSAIDVTQGPRNHSSSVERDQGWLQEDAEYSNPRDGYEDMANGPSRTQGASSDFWLPQVDASGQVCCIIACNDTRDSTLIQIRFSTSILRLGSAQEIYRRRTGTHLKVT